MRSAVGLRSRTRSCLTALLALLSLTGLAQAGEPAHTCEPRGRPWLEGRIRGRTQLASVVDAKLGEEVEIFVVMPGTLDGRPVQFSEDGSPGRVSWSGSGCPKLRVAFQRVEPRMQHTITKAPNGELKVYANSVIFGPSHGKWLGYDQLEYFETPLPASPADPGAARLLVRDARPTTPAAARPVGHEGLGTMRLAATVALGATTLQTPGVGDVAAGLISDRVFRYSFRQGDGFLGWLTAFYNVPYLFGSAGEGSRNQTERLLGADCADILVGALRRAGRRDLHYTNVGGVIDALGRSAGPTLVAACPSQAPGQDASAILASCQSRSDPPLRFGKDVQPGDILAVDYVGAGDLPRAWDHIVVLVEDRGPSGIPDGILGPHDIVADSGDAQALKFTPLNEQGTVRVLAARPRRVPIF